MQRQHCETLRGSRTLHAAPIQGADGRISAHAACAVSSSVPHQVYCPVLKVRTAKPPPLFTTVTLQAGKA